MTTEKTKEQQLEEIGRCAMDSIRNMVEALECDYERLEELRDNRKSWGEEAYPGDGEGQTEKEVSWEEANPDDAAELKELEEAAGECTSQDDARERIEQDPLSLEFRSGWVSNKEDMEPEEYCLLLSTGGPATRIIGEIDRGEPSSARLQVQDWFIPWTEHIVTGTDYDALMTYVRCFYMGD